MYSTLWDNTLTVDEMLWNTKNWIFQNQNKTFPCNENILKICQTAYTFFSFFSSSHFWGRYMTCEVIYIISRRKAFFMKRIPETSYVQKETNETNILLTFRNEDWKIIQPIREMWGATIILRKQNQFSQFRWAYTNNLGWLYFDDDQQSSYLQDK